MPRSYVLGDHFEHFIDSQVESGRFNSASEVVRAGLRLLEDRESAPSLHDLRDRLREGMNGGPGRPATEVLDRLERKYRRLVWSMRSASSGSCTAHSEVEAVFDEKAGMSAEATGPVRGRRM